MKLYKLINPSDPYTFYAPSLEVAAVAAYLLSRWYGVKSANDSNESSCGPLGWQQWLEDRGIDESWIQRHSEQLAAAFESFLIGGAKERADVESMLALLPADKKEQWRAERQDRHRSSLNAIGERAYELAAHFRNSKQLRTSESE